MSFERRFEGGEVLDGLLDLAGARVDAKGAVEVFQEAHAAGAEPGDVIPSFFNGEPRFSSPELARKLYGNLLGLWDLIAEGKMVSLEKPAGRPRPKKVVPVAPPPFGNEGPSQEYVEAAWRYLQDLGDKGRQPLSHTFENRQDALLGWLDEQGLSDNAFASARYLLFELFSMLEVGWPPGIGNVRREALQGGRQAPEPVPAALTSYADEALFEAEQDEETPLSPAEVARVKELVTRGLAALWNARRPRK